MAKQTNLFTRITINDLTYNTHIYPKKVGRYTKLCIELNTNTKKRTDEKITEFIVEGRSK